MPDAETPFRVALSPDGTEDLSWQENALCTQVDAEIFFPEKGRSPRDAKKICAGCDVREQCLQWAMATNQRHGVWGGLTSQERSILARDGDKTRKLRTTKKTVREDVIVQLHKASVPPTEIAQRFEITERTVHRIVKRARERQQQSA
jgi:WhiB family transcriptional regulator, redox-sensing transcriptional regulator